ncbi:unnamed protein product [Dovyalis caffra]|uniref:Uncharacterized protein n=1 Tax=Dovyalis caffra TaxID=77055 RepID=A0AAV1RIL4_9ROSI|nr:unnamed protein product [Dovyalis caffra]
MDPHGFKLRAHAEGRTPGSETGVKSAESPPQIFFGPDYSRDQRPPPQECKELVGDAQDNILEKERIPTCVLVRTLMPLWLASHWA